MWSTCLWYFCIKGTFLSSGILSLFTNSFPEPLLPILVVVPSYSGFNCIIILGGAGIAVYLVKPLPAILVVHVKALVWVSTLHSYPAACQYPWRGWLQYLSPCYPHGIPEWRSRLFILAWPGSIWCDHLGKKPVVQRYCFLSLSLHLTFK